MCNFNTNPFYKTFCHLFVIKYDKMSYFIQNVEKYTHKYPF